MYTINFHFRNQIKTRHCSWTGGHSELQSRSTLVRKIVKRNSNQSHFLNLYSDEEFEFFRSFKKDPNTAASFIQLKRITLKY